MMFGLTGAPLYVGIGVLVVIVALSGALWVQTSRLDAKVEKIKAMELVVAAYEQKVSSKEAKIVELRAVIAEQNEKIEDMAEWGRLAEERQRVIDELMEELSRAKADLKVIADKYVEMREAAVGLDVCQTYEMVIRSIVEGVAP